MASIEKDIRAALEPIYGRISLGSMLARWGRANRDRFNNERWWKRGFSFGGVPATALWLPGVPGNYVSTPAHADFNFTTDDFSVVIGLTLDDYTPSSYAALIGCWSTSAPNSQWNLRLETSGDLSFYRRTIGNNTQPLLDSPTFSVSSVATGGEPIWLAVTYSYNPNTATPWYSLNEGQTWTSGTTNTNTLAPMAATNPNPCRIGQYNEAEGAGSFSGVVHYAAVYNGIGANTAPGQGTLVAEFRADAPVDVTGKVWTISGDAWSWVEVE